MKNQESLNRLWRHLRYLWRAKTRYQIHSPYVYALADEVLDDRRYFYPYEELEDLREELKAMDAPIEKVEYGAGSSVIDTRNATVAQIAKYNQSHPRVGQFLFRLVHWLKPSTLLELGTSFGITTGYQAYAAPQGHMITIEGCPHTAGMAIQTLEAMGLSQVEVRIGRFEEELSQALEELGRLDYAFIDGNHRREPTLAYFEACLPYVHNDSVLVFDDVRWSQEMHEAWEAIKAHERVTLTVEVFDVGLVFFRKEQAHRQHFDLIPSRYKPQNTLKWI